jgi:hypothetical protein
MIHSHCDIPRTDVGTVYIYGQPAYPRTISYSTLSLKTTDLQYDLQDSNAFIQMITETAC